MITRASGAMPLTVAIRLPKIEACTPESPATVLDVCVPCPSASRAVCSYGSCPGVTLL